MGIQRRVGYILRSRSQQCLPSIFWSEEQYFRHSVNAPSSAMFAQSNKNSKETARERVHWRMGSTDVSSGKSPTDGQMSDEQGGSNINPFTNIC